MTAPYASERLKGLLNRAVAAEMAAAIQYMWQHVMLVGIDAEQVGAVLRATAMKEMAHAEAVAERLNYFGGVPTVKPDPIYVGGDAQAMIGVDIAAEEAAIAIYTDLLQAARDEDDHATALMAKQLLLDEQGHHDTFLTLAGQKPDVGAPRVGD